LLRSLSFLMRAFAAIVALELVLITAMFFLP
jgi:hypothetical protein